MKLLSYRYIRGCVNTLLNIVFFSGLGVFFIDTIKSIDYKVQSF